MKFSRYSKNHWAECLAILVFIALSIICLYNPLGLEDKLFGTESRTPAKTLTYIGVVSGAILVLGNLYSSNKRNLLTEKAQENVIKQINIAEKAQINTRFKDAAQLLASNETSAILSGIYALHQIAEEVAKQGDEAYKGYVKVIHDILCAYVRENWKKEMEKEAETPTKYKPTIILQTIMDILFKNKNNIYREYYSDFSHCIIKDVDFSKARLDNVNFFQAKLEKVSFNIARLENVNFTETILKGYSHEEITRFGRSLELTSPKNAAKWEEDRKRSIAELFRGINEAKINNPERN